MLEVKGEGKSIWQGDCLQFAFDPQNDALPRQPYTNDDEYGHGIASHKHPASFLKLMLLPDTLP